MHQLGKLMHWLRLKVSGNDWRQAELSGRIIIGRPPHSAWPFGANAKRIKTERTQPRTNILPPSMEWLKPKDVGSKEAPFHETFATSMPNVWGTEVNRGGGTKV